MGAGVSGEKRASRQAVMVEQTGDDHHHHHHHHHDDQDLHELQLGCRQTGRKKIKNSFGEIEFLPV